MANDIPEEYNAEEEEKEKRKEQARMAEEEARARFDEGLEKRLKERIKPPGEGGVPEATGAAAEAGEAGAAGAGEAAGAGAGAAGAGAGGAAGAGAGAAGGAAGGAAVGAAAGSVVPGPGTAVGAEVGAETGAAGGGAAGAGAGGAAGAGAGATGKAAGAGKAGSLGKKAGLGIDQMEEANPVGGKAKGKVKKTIDRGTEKLFDLKKGQGKMMRRVVVFGIPISLLTCALIAAVVPVLLILFIAIVPTFVTPFLGGGQKAKAAQECTSTTLNQDVMDRINKNRSVYESAAQKQNIPWEMLAAVHYREANCDPNKSVMSGEPLGTENPDNHKTYYTLQESADAAAEHLKTMDKSVYGYDLSTVMSSSLNTDNIYTWQPSWIPKAYADQYDMWNSNAYTAQQINDYLKKNHPQSPLNGKGQAYVDAGKKYGVNPGFMLGIANAETSLGMQNLQPGNALYGTNNPCGIGCGNCKKYGSWEEGIEGCTKNAGSQSYKRLKDMREFRLKWCGYESDLGESPPILLSDGTSISYSCANGNSKWEAEVKVIMDQLGTPSEDNEPQEDEKAKIIKHAFLAYNRGSMYKNNGCTVDESPYVMNQFDANHQNMKWPDSACEPTSTRGKINIPAGAYTVYIILKGQTCTDGNVPGDEVGQKIVAIAQKELKTMPCPCEHNNVGECPRKYGCGDGNQWCSCFASWVYKEAGAPIGHDPNNWCHPYSGKAIELLDIHDDNPQPGDVFGVQGDRVDYSKHIGIITKLEGDTVWVIDGNSGDCVKEHTYSMDEFLRTRATFTYVAGKRFHRWKQK